MNDYQDGQLDLSAQLSGEQSGTVHVMVKDVAGNAVIEQTCPVAEQIQLPTQQIKNVHQWNNH
ncbi:hypothetical protein, partial [Bartonella sp. CL63NXGY]|uniref:hypothetical protein n=1 Tax=Bartonella sp. CL63NXGY TaxID=3243538 RepID=UPI0035CE9CA8